jgi:translocation and assembly module TamA
MTRPLAASQLIILLAMAWAGHAAAMELKQVEIVGIDGELAANVRARLSIDRMSPAQRSNISETRLAFLLKSTLREVEQGLEPFGYYNAEVVPEQVHSGDQVTVRITITPGEPVRVRELQLKVDGPAQEDKQVAAKIADFHPITGEQFRHDTYERNKVGISRTLTERGYFDAELSNHVVEVTRSENAADINLLWDSGPRYTLGPVVFEGSQFRPGVLEPLVHWKPGATYDQAKLEVLQRSLSDTDYFSAVSLAPDPENAVDGQVPVNVLLVPAKRSVYGVGLLYGTDQGAGVAGHLERRWLNDRGHKLLFDMNLAERDSIFTTQYRVPAFGWLDGWYSYSINMRDNEINHVASQYAELIAARTGKFRAWDLLAGLNYKRERSNPLDPDQYTYVNLLYPTLWGQWKKADDPNTPRHGRLLAMTVRGGSSTLGSDVSFLQMRVEGRYIRALAASSRLLLRAELGATASDSFSELPPSMRFYAGGDRSVRGYDYQEIGVYNGVNTVGGKYLVSFSTEFEHMFTPVWGGAFFIDAGDAFDNQIDVQYGVGFGLRWRSPVGPVRVDIAHGIGDPGQSVRLNISIGPDL